MRESRKQQFHLFIQSCKREVIDVCKTLFVKTSSSKIIPFPHRKTHDKEGDMSGMHWYQQVENSMRLSFHPLEYLPSMGLITDASHSSVWIGRLKKNGNGDMSMVKEKPVLEKKYLGKWINYYKRPILIVSYLNNKLEPIFCNASYARNKSDRLDHAKQMLIEQISRDALVGMCFDKAIDSIDRNLNKVYIALYCDDYHKKLSVMQLKLMRIIPCTYDDLNAFIIEFSIPYTE